MAAATKQQEGIMAMKQIGKISLNMNDVLSKASMKGSMLFSGTLNDGRTKIAVKKVVDSITNLEEVKKLIRLSKEKQHDNVIRYFLVEHEEPFYYIALEWCQGTLNDFVEKPGFNQRGLTDVEVARQMACGLSHIHSCDIFHLDLKPSNVLIARANDTTNRVVISDFDVSKCSEGGKSLRTFTFAGSEGWLAPEISVFSYQYRYSCKVDMFALGCLIYYVITKGLHPFHDEPNVELNACQKNIILYSEGNYDLTLEGLDKTTRSGLLAADLIFQLLEKSPKRRPDVSTCLEHPVFWDSLKQRKFLEATGDMLYDDTGDRLSKRLDTDSWIVIGNEWDVDDQVKPFVGQGEYDRQSLSNLLRFVRDHYTHLWERKTGASSLQECGKDGRYDLLQDVNRRYPGFLLHVFHVTVPWRREGKLKEFYPKDDSYIQMWDDGNSIQVVEDMNCVWESVTDLQIANIENAGEFSGVAIDRQGRMVITDIDQHCVHLLNNDGSLVPHLDTNSFDRPRDIAIDPEGNIAVADIGKNAVFLFDKEGQLKKTITRAEGKNLNEPNGLAFTTSGKLVICDTRNHRVLVYSKFEFDFAFGVKGKKPGQLSLPWMVSVDDNDMVYITDADNHRVQVFTLLGRFCRKIGSRGIGKLQFREPTGIVAFRDCFLVTDLKNKRVQVISKTGKYVGSLGPKLGGDQEDFNHVWGVACQEDGERASFFVADRVSKVRIVKLTFTVTKTARVVAVSQENED